MDALLVRLRAAPVVPLAAAALGVLVYTGAHDDRTSMWQPASLILLGLLAVALVGVPVAWRAVPLSVKLAAGFLAAFTAWSFLGIAWSDAGGDAWNGADRTLAYLVVFLLFALWPLPTRAAVVLLGLWIAAIAVIGLIVLLSVSGAHDPSARFVGGRLASPLGYINASAAMYLMPMWPAGLLASRYEIPWPVRGLLATATVVLAEVAFLSQSRGSVIAVGVCVILVFVLAVGRVRAAFTLAPIALGIAIPLKHLVHVTNRFSDGDHGALHGVAGPVLTAAIVVGMVVAALAFADRSWRPEPGRRGRARRLGGIAAAVGAVVIVAVALVAVGNPAHRVRNEWHSFTHGYSNTPTSGSRLASGLGSNRYDFYRVAWGQFRRSPLIGAGTDQFFEDYLARGHSDETPHYPHSIELRTLGELGLIGAVLLLGFLVSAGWALARARRGPPFRGAVAAGAAMAFAYWLVHGSGDWFFEIFTISAPAFALIGMACGLAPRTAQAPATARFATWPARLRLAGMVAAGIVAFLAFALPWLASRDIDRAASTWPSNPGAAFSRLNRAADLNFLSDEPQTTAATIALNQNDLAHAAREFRAALKRDPRDDYATLELGAIAASQGDFATAVPILERARKLFPRDPLTLRTLQQAQAHKRLDIASFNDALDQESVD